ncbi:class I SAM-dependent methyltransferase [Glycomyces harbinensis]|uniref:Methyltransferase domain-containing protein n=1 Tax=Glycomyces harbinensis TaxID=58114 RepID=A0A1G6RY15_9ACTN|nr:class I SAM-dependent methyltransferase [Glycomyces harbinensis]SDD09343.1 Methyltransferase domain-containing protein [Glycomyces harbinensis]
MSTDAATQSAPDPRKQALSFGQAADLYDSIRPTYPAEALRWQIGDAEKDVLDIGAGTGLLTRVLIGLGHRVTAVEPDDQMRAKLTASSPGLTAALAGSAEALPVPDAGAGAITAGQSFHWFDRPRALPELRRALRPDGILAPIWNIRDESVPWVRALTEAIGSSPGEIDGLGATEPGYFGPDFGEAEHRCFHHEMPLDRPRLIRLVQSRSYYLTADDAGRRRIVAAVDDVIDSHPELAGSEAFAMPYKTYAFRVRPA